MWFESWKQPRKAKIILRNKQKKKKTKGFVKTKLINRH